MSEIPKELLNGLKDWSVGKTSDEVADTLGEAGQYAVVLTFDDPKTCSIWAAEMLKTWNTKASPIEQKFSDCNGEGLEKYYHELEGGLRRLRQMSRKDTR